MTAILGLNLGHADSSAALLLDGRLVGAVSEERLGERIKHDSSFPSNAIRSVLAMGGISLKEVDYIAVPRDTSKNRGAKVRYVLANPMSSLAAVIVHQRRARKARGLLEQVADACGVDPRSMRAKLVPVEHHLSHVASAYYSSPFDSAAGASYDGSGDFASMMLCRCEGTKIDVLERVTLPHSLGYFYTAICQFIGFDQFAEEYKVMGLAPYGENRFAPLMQKLLKLEPDGLFSLNQAYFQMHGGEESGVLDANRRIIVGTRYSQRLTDEVGAPRARNAEMTQRDKDLAKSCQIRFEEAVLHCMRRLHKLVPSKNIATAGGCALNGVANARILAERAGDAPLFEDAYVQAASADDGCSLGAALWAWHNVAGGVERFHMEHAYWGPEHSAAEMAAAAGRSRSMRVEVPTEAVPRVGARLIREGLVMGWYHGRSEWGPRALGNRSIVADPTRPEMKELINEKIKRRESFRPFAPAVLRTATSRLFEQDIYSPFMNHVVKIRPQFREQLPAVTHSDGTGRLQSVDRASNPLFCQLIESFERLSQMPVVLNTSFNENEPVVDTPEQALQCYLRTGLDALCLGQQFMVKPEHNATFQRVLAAEGVATPVAAGA